MVGYYLYTRYVFIKVGKDYIIHTVQSFFAIGMSNLPAAIAA